jgi:hypothetical protein
MVSALSSGENDDLAGRAILFHYPMSLDNLVDVEDWAGFDARFTAFDRGYEFL